MAAVSSKSIPRSCRRNCLQLSNRPRIFVRVQCSEKAAALAELQASQKGLSEHLENGLKSSGEKGAEATTVSLDADIEEIDQTNYYERIEAADAPVVLVDFYTAWCGPCKLMYPKLVDLSREYAGKVTFFKFNCNKKNKELGQKLGIRVAPTFIMYKNGEQVEMLTGAKMDPLLAAIEKHTA